VVLQWIIKEEEEEGGEHRSAVNVRGGGGLHLAIECHHHYR